MAKTNPPKTNLIARFITEDSGNLKQCVLEVIMPDSIVQGDHVRETIEAEDWNWYETNRAPGNMMALRFTDARSDSFAWHTKHEEKDGLRRANIALKKLGITALKVRGRL